MRVVTGAQMAEIDQKAIQQIGIPVEALMENAGLALAQTAWEMLGLTPGWATPSWLEAVPGRVPPPRRPFRHPPRVIVLAGRGNNGGDGCVAARYLANWGARVRVYRPADGRSSSRAGSSAAGAEARKSPGHEGGGPSLRETAARQFDILTKLGVDVSVVSMADISKVKLNLAMADLVIDALLGTGFRGEPEGVTAALIDAMNEAGVPVLAADIPSGVDASSGRVTKAVRAQVTVTFGLPKIGNLLFPGADYCGSLRVVDIGFPPSLLLEGADLWWLRPEMVRSWLPPRPAQSHKGTYGHVLVVAGSRGMTGAGHLAVRGALRMGAGLVTWALPASLQDAMAPHVPEALTAGLPDGGSGIYGEDGVEEIARLMEGKKAVVIGPGLGRQPRTSAFVRAVLSRLEVPTVIDADGLYALTHPELSRPFAGLSPKGAWVLTPHAGEMARLMGCSVADVTADPLGMARRAAVQYGAVVVLKGARTVIAAPDGRAWINSTGSPVMATGGSGDVLAGAIGALLAQGLPTWQAAAVAVYLHGLSGERVAREHGASGMLVRELADRLPLARKEILNHDGAGIPHDSARPTL